MFLRRPHLLPACGAGIESGAKRCCRAGRGDKPAARSSESTSIRVAVEKVDQLINPVGELVITQSMLAQRSNELGPGDPRRSDHQHGAVAT